MSIIGTSKKNVTLGEIKQVINAIEKIRSGRNGAEEPPRLNKAERTISRFKSRKKFDKGDWSWILAKSKWRR